ncbi:MAG: hypothetical protein HY327_12495 [Chloroflexi bacterium]|nr:hypothetical protein [Chloroflexota bacterium]
MPEIVLEDVKPTHDALLTDQSNITESPKLTDAGETLKYLMIGLLVQSGSLGI